MPEPEGRPAGNTQLSEAPQRCLDSDLDLGSHAVHIDGTAPSDLTTDPLRPAIVIGQQGIQVPPRIESHPRRSTHRATEAAPTTRASRAPPSIADSARRQSRASPVEAPATSVARMLGTGSPPAATTPRLAISFSMLPCRPSPPGYCRSTTNVRIPRRSTVSRGLLTNPPEAVTRLLVGRHHLERLAMEQAVEVD
jgi:hypothetical protein